MARWATPSNSIRSGSSAAPGRTSCSACWPAPTPVPATRPCTPEHGFLIYPIATRAAGATPVAVAERDQTADVDALLAAVTPATRIVFLANPNNPTGTYLPAEEMRRLRVGLPEGVLLVIDAAYAEYVDADDYRTGIDLVDAFGTVVVTRTFSKIYGLGGIRLGWAYLPAPVADVLNRLRMPFNVSSRGAGRRASPRWRIRLRRTGAGAQPALAAVDPRCDPRPRPAVPESQGNFVLVRFPPDTRDAVAADAYLKSRGIIARRVAAYGLPDCLRISIGLESEMRACVSALADFVASGG